MMTRKMNEQEERLFDVMERYREQFGDGHLLPLMQVKAEATYTEFLIELYERCLVEGKLAKEYVKVYNDPNVEY